MPNFTVNTYILKRKIFSFSNKISKLLPKPDRNFVADITYGMLASGSCLLTDVVDQLHEPSNKTNVVDPLSRHLKKRTPNQITASYLREVKKWVPKDPIIHIDDSDVVKPDGLNSRPSVLFGTAPKAPLQKAFTKLVNSFTFQVMGRGAALFGKTTVAMDRGGV